MNLLAGTAIADITPPEGLELGGYPHYPRHNTGVHDPLHAGCLYLDDGQTQIAMVTLDILFFSKIHVARVRHLAGERTGIPADHIMISCSHTHSGPWASGRLDIESLMAGVQQDAAYVERLVTQIVDIIVEARQTAFEAELGYGAHACGKAQGIGGNRRDPDGPCDPFVYFLAVRDLAGMVRSVMVNYALHPTVIHEDSTLVTADYPGYVRAVFSEAFPEAVMLFAQGTSGDQSTRYFRQGQSFDEAERIGRIIGSCAARAVADARYGRDIRLEARSESLAIPIRELPERALMEARVRELKAAYEEKLRQGAPYLEVQNANLWLLGAEDLLGYIVMMAEGRKIELLEDERPAEIQVMTIGGLKVVGLPGEIFVDFGLAIKARVEADLVIVNTLANGCLPGYVCTREAHAAGGYETGTSLLDVSYGYAMTEAAVALAGR